MNKRSWTDEQLVQAVSEASSIADVCRSLGLAGGGSYRTIRAHSRRLGLDLSHFKGQGWLRDQTHAFGGARPLHELLVKDSTTSNGHLKKRLLRGGLLGDRCAICKLTIWLGKPIVLHLDHINGDRTDNRIKNLRLLCPNCHSQTDTYCGRNICRPPPKTCVDCGDPISKNAVRCCGCGAIHRARTRQWPKPKTTWPPSDELRALVQKRGFRAVGRSLGVSDNAIRKHLRVRGATNEPRW